MSEEIEREAFEVVVWLQSSRLPGYEITAIQSAESIKRLMNQYRASNNLIEEQAARIAEAEKDYHEERRARYAAQSELIASQARLSEAVKVLEEAKTWHEEQDKSLSKQPPTHGPSGNQWARLQHREQIDILEAFLATLGEET